MEDSIEIAFQNKASSVEYSVDTELEDNLRDLQNVNDDELEIILNTHDDDDNHTNSNEEVEFVDDEETSPEEEFHDVNLE